ncbi:translation machinery-associated protein 22 [Cladochytrium replicatum]|nr:translation machinery-associated protein 22 [Cladochytrium replicatum]
MDEVEDVEAVAVPELPAYVPRETKHTPSILYCAVCSVPPEYCDFGTTKEKCRGWLASEHPDVFARLYPDEQQDGAAEPKIDAAAPAPAPAAPSKKKKTAAPTKVIVKRVERNKRKFVTVVSNLELFDVDLKKAAKLFANKFACGSSVTKTPTGGEEIVVQGDVSDDIVDVILSNYKKITDDLVDVIVK